MMYPTSVTLPTHNEILALLRVDELRSQQRIAFTSEDVFIEDCIKDAYDYFDGPEGWLNRSILTQTWKIFLPCFSDNLELPLPPLQSVTKVRYKDTDNAWQTLSDSTVSPAVTSSVFEVLTSGTHGRIVRAYNQNWPDTYQSDEAVEITFTCGYGAASAVESRARGIKRGIRLLAGHLFRNREQTYAEPRLVQVPRNILFGLEKFAGMYRIPNNHA